MWWERIEILGMFAMFLAAVTVGVGAVAAILGGVNGDDDDEAPAPTVVPTHDRPRPRLTALRAPATRDDVRAVRMDLARISARARAVRVRPFLCGVPLADEAAEQLRAHAQMCQPKDAA